MSSPALFLLIALLSFLAAQPPQIVQPRSVMARGADGKVLNLDFETGDLRDWTVEGEAFKGQPIKGDASRKRRAEMPSNHQGEYWIGGYELHQDRPQGTLTSAAFRVTHRWAAFLVGGGPMKAPVSSWCGRTPARCFIEAQGTRPRR
jgi:hypothetical protein